MKHKKHLFIIIFALFFTVSCSCGLIEKLFASGDEQVVVTESDGSLIVDATAAAEAESAIQTQMAAMSATQQALVERMEATAQSISGMDMPTPAYDPADIQTPVAPGATTVSVSVDTNCRSGPGVGYQVVDGVFVGQTVEVLGVDASGAYYIVKSPYGKVCWIWSRYATLNGDPDSLTVMTPPAPDYDVVNDDWQDWLVIEPVDGFRWDRHWVIGAPGNQSHADWYNAQVADCAECFRIDSMEMDIVRSGDFLDIELTQTIYWLDGGAATHVIYGLAEVSPDDTVASGLFYFEEVVYHSIGQNIGTSWALNTPILWYQSASPDYFLGDFSEYVRCGAISGSGFPVPCVWP